MPAPSVRNTATRIVQDDDSDSDDFDVADDNDSHVVHLPQLSLFLRVFTFVGRVSTPAARSLLTQMRISTTTTTTLRTSPHESTPQDDAQHPVDESVVSQTNLLAVPPSTSMRPNDIDHNNDAIIDDPTRKRVSTSTLEDRRTGKALPDVYNNDHNDVVPTAMAAIHDSPDVRSRRRVLARRVLRAIQMIATEHKLQVHTADDLTQLQTRIVAVIQRLDIAAAPASTFGMAAKETKLLALLLLVVTTADVVTAWCTATNKEPIAAIAAAAAAASDEAPSTDSVRLDAPQVVARVGVRLMAPKTIKMTLGKDTNEHHTWFFGGIQPSIVDAVLAQVDVDAAQFRTLCGVLRRAPAPSVSASTSMLMPTSSSSSSSSSSLVTATTR